MLHCLLAVDDLSSGPPVQNESAPQDDFGSESDCAHKGKPLKPLPASTAYRAAGPRTAEAEITRLRSAVSNYVCLADGSSSESAALLDGRMALERLVQTAQQVTVTQHGLDPLGAELVPGESA